ncbi:HD domain-containing protein [Rhodococcus sp. 3Y1]
MNHSLRCWIWADAFAQIDAIEYDPEDLFTACALHDVGLGAEGSAEHGCFTYISAADAEELATRVGTSERSVQRIGEAIRLHMDLTVDRGAALTPIYCMPQRISTLPVGVRPKFREQLLMQQSRSTREQGSPTSSRSRCGARSSSVRTLARRRSGDRAWHCRSDQSPGLEEPLATSSPRAPRFVILRRSRYSPRPRVRSTSPPLPLRRWDNARLREATNNSPG